ncbi:TPA: urease accessory protein UreG, partial [Salmonella enterica subsp. diarizonae serovar 61:l,v:z35]
YVGASLEVMESDTRYVRNNRPYILTNCKTGEGIEQVVDMIERDFLFGHTIEGKKDDSTT